jgi:F-type H+-transporting ATPase subunit b
MIERAQAFASTAAAGLLAAFAALAAPAAALAATAAGPAEAAPEAGNNVFAGDVGYAIWTVLIFVLVLVVLGKYAWGPLLTGLQQREAFIREALETARRDREQAEQRLREYEEKLAASRAEATAIIEEGRRDAEAVKRRIEEQAKQESDKMIERARREIAAATAEAARQLYAQAARLATELAARVIGRELDPKDHERLIAESIEEIAARRN